MAKRERPGKKLLGAYVDEWLYLALLKRAEKHHTSISVELIKLLLQSQGFIKLDNCGAILECADSELVDAALKHTEKQINGSADSSASITRLLMQSHKLIKQANMILEREGKPALEMVIKRKVVG